MTDKKTLGAAAGGLGAAFAAMFGYQVVSERATVFSHLPNAVAAAEVRLGSAEGRLNAHDTQLAQAAEATRELTEYIRQRDAERAADLAARRAVLDAQKEQREEEERALQRRILQALEAKEEDD